MPSNSNQRTPAERRRIARVESQPDYRITLDGRDISMLFAPRLESLTITENRADQADTVDITLDDTRGDLALPTLGAELKVAIGWSGEPLVDKGTYIVNTVSWSGTPDTLSVSAHSAAMSEGMQQRRERSWHQQTIGAIVQVIAARYALQPVVGATLAAIRIAHVDQTHESDMSFLTRLAKRYDAVMNVKDKRLLFMPIDTGKSASGKPLAVLALTRADGDHHQYRSADRDKYDAVRANYHSNGKGRRLSVTVKGETSKNVKVLTDDYASQEEAMAAAQAEYKRMQRGKQTLAYSLARGRPEVFPETPVSFSGLKPEIDAIEWLIKSARHTLDNNGLQTELELETREDAQADKKNAGKTATPGAAS